MKIYKRRLLFLLLLLTFTILIFACTFIHIKEKRLEVEEKADFQAAFDIIKQLREWKKKKN